MKHNIGLDFARIIRAMLRQAPNIILVGEMRDQETASMGIQASLTGHLVFSTLHTNDAPGAVTRMVDMGVPDYLVASSVIAVLAQRLVRVDLLEVQAAVLRLPSACSKTRASRPSMAAKRHLHEGQRLRALQQEWLPRPHGIFELMMMTSKVRELIFQSASSQEIRKVAISQGMKTLYVDGI